MLAEYDALSGLSQVGGCTEHRERTPGGSGHGCGHNLLGAGSFGAALGIKAWLEETGAPGTITLYGCPGEEGGAAKAFMARDGLWKELDAALTWHPLDVNEVVTGSSSACIQVQYQFRGIASHASAAPELGRSALDAVELMNVGVQFLREHMGDRARIHYAITDTGGISPNVVQPRAGALYMVRSDRVAEAIKLLARVDKIAQGAALMTETEVERIFIDGLSETICNHALERVLYQNFRQIGVPSYTEEELAFADALSATYEKPIEPPGIAAKHDPQLRREVESLRAQCSHAMNTFLAPLYQGDAYEHASTDVGDVSWLTPTAQIHVAAWPDGCPGHSWQNVSGGNTELGRKAALCAAQILAAAAIDLFETPSLLQEARAEFEERTKAGFVSPIPADAVPRLPEL